MMKSKYPRLSVKAVRKELRYDKLTGFLWWRKRASGRRMNRPAGSLNHGYVRIRCGKNSYHAHALAWVIVKGRWPPSEIDHRDTVKNNNRWKNIRLATHSQNRQNIGAYKNNKSGSKRVVLQDGRYWRADIQVDGKQRYLGIFDTKEQASAAYVMAAKKLHKQFARF